MEHTPTPWSQGMGAISGHLKIYSGSKLIADANGNKDGSLEEHTANAAFIVKACNSHEALVAALENAKIELEREYGINPGEGIGGVFVEINAALKLANNGG